MKAQLWSEWFAEHQHPLYRYLYRGVRVARNCRRVIAGDLSPCHALPLDSSCPAGSGVALQSGAAFVYGLAAQKTSEKSRRENLRCLFSASLRPDEPEAI